MKLRTLMAAGTAVALAAVSTTAVAWTAKPQPESKRAAAPSPPRTAVKPSADDVRRALAALARIDDNRLARDGAYAEEILRNIRLARSLPLDTNVEIAMLRLETRANITLTRHDAARSAADRLVAMRPTRAGDYWEAWVAAAEVDDHARMASLVVTALDAVREEEQRHILFEMFHPEGMWFLYRVLKDGGEVERLAMAEALVAADWPGQADPEARDRMRMVVLRARAERGDLDGAKPIADRIESLEPLIELSVMRRFDPLGVGADPLGRLAAGIAATDQGTAARLAERPDDLSVLTDRARFLRSTGRAGEALALLGPRLADPAALAGESEKGMWLVNEAAGAFSDLGRSAEAADLMSRMVAADIVAKPYLTSVYINHLVALWEAGRADESLERALLVEREYNRYASIYGRMWIWSAAVCALSALERMDEAAEWFAKLEEHSGDNGSAHMRALLCAGDEDAAEALLLRRLGESDPAGLIIGLQNYRGDAGPGPMRELFARLMRVRDRPAVASAIGRVGRILEIPLARTYYGDM